MSSVAVVGGGDATTEALARRLSERDTASAETPRCEVITDPEVSAERLSRGGFAALVYVAATRGASRSPDGLPDLDDAAAVFQACAGSTVTHVLVVSSAAVHEPSHHHPGVVSEDRLAPLRHGNRIAARWRDLETLAADMLAAETLPDETLSDETPGRRNGVALTVLRPVTTPVSSGPNNHLGRLLTARLALTLPGHDPSVQLLSLEDLSEAVARAVEEGRTGTWHVAPERPVPLRKALRRAGVRRLPIPRWMQSLVIPADELAYIRYSWTVSGERLGEELGFVPRRSSAEVARALSRPIEEGGKSSPEDAAGGPGGAPDFDEWGLDTDYIAAFERTLFRFLHDVYWRVELAGLEHLPRQGAAVLTGVHRGFQPWDGVMAVVAVRRATGRTPRFLLHPTLVKMPFLANYMTKLGGIHACQENADRILGREDLLAIFPEGIRGAFSYYRDAYELKRFGRDEYVKMALRNRAPIVPFVTVGSAEIYPILGKLHWRWWKRWAEWPCLPITPTMGTLPLPSKWHTRFLPPLHVEQEHGPEAADDPEVVRAVSERVQRSMRDALDEILTRRRSIFWGEVFDG